MKTIKLARWWRAFRAEVPPEISDRELEAAIIVCGCIAIGAVIVLVALAAQALAGGGR